MTDKHTPASWKLIEVMGHSGVYEGKQCILGYTRPTKTQKANAHLIAAAPELLEALEGMIRLYSGCYEGLDPLDTEERFKIRNEADKAIAKARGESQ